jgi:hypothetical protein
MMHVTELERSLLDLPPATHRIIDALHHCDQGRAATAVEVFPGQCTDESAPVSQDVRRCVERALASAATLIKEQT